MIELDILKRPVLLDGGMGRELRFRGVEVPGTIWSAGALTTAPEVVRQIHMDYIHAGADVITINSYGIIRKDLARENMEDCFAELNRTAGKGDGCHDRIVANRFQIRGGVCQYL